MTGGSWLSWNAKKNESINQLSESNEDVIDEDEEHPNDEESEHDDTVPDDNGDEVDDHVKEKEDWAGHFGEILIRMWSPRCKM